MSMRTAPRRRFRCRRRRPRTPLRPVARRRAGLSDDFIATFAARPYTTLTPPALAAGEQAGGSFYRRSAAGPRPWLLPNLGAEGGRRSPASARGFRAKWCWARGRRYSTPRPVRPLLPPPGRQRSANELAGGAGNQRGRAGPWLPARGLRGRSLAWHPERQPSRSRSAGPRPGRPGPVHGAHRA